VCSNASHAAARHARRFAHSAAHHQFALFSGLIVLRLDAAGRGAREPGVMRDRFEHILAADDDAVGSDDVLVRAVCMARATGARLMVARPLGAKILDLAAALARAQGGRLHVVHCWDVDGAEAEMLRSEIADDTRRAILQRHERRHRDAVESLIARHRGALDEIETHLPRGPAQPAIVSPAEQRDVGLLVMGLPSRSALSGLLVGNSVERVLDLVRCDVLAVKPDEFRTPVAVHSVGAQADLHRR
jgi:nucleotide-binding universal stress UspA family protein